MSPADIREELRRRGYALEHCLGGAARDLTRVWCAVRTRAFVWEELPGNRWRVHEIGAIGVNVVVDNTAPRHIAALIDEIERVTATGDCPYAPGCDVGVIEHVVHAYRVTWQKYSDHCVDIDAGVADRGISDPVLTAKRLANHTGYSARLQRPFDYYPWGRFPDGAPICSQQDVERLVENLINRRVADEMAR